MIINIQNNNNKNLRINQIYCIGMNYVDHAKELNYPIPKEPIIFLKSLGSLASNGSNFILPNTHDEIHYEGEFFVMLKYNCARINEKEAQNVILGYGVGIDYTNRTQQLKDVSQGLPWTKSKNFFGSCVISEIVLKENIDFNNYNLELYQNNNLKQKEKLTNMIFNIYEIISYLSYLFELQVGDIIFTGTPKGVSSVKHNDLIKCRIEGLTEVISYVKNSR